MAIIENFLKWSLIAIVGMMAITAIGGALTGAMVGVMSTPGFFVLLVIATLILMAIGAGVVGIGGLWLWRWWRMSAIREDQAREFIAPDEGGRLPVPASLLRTTHGGAMAMQHNMASFTPNLSHYHYQPQQENTYNGADGQAMTTAAAAVTPGTFWQLYQSGALPDNGFLMGYSLDEDGQEVTADWRKLYSALIGGQSNSGKSTLIRGILAQSALQGGRFVIIDPHYGAGDESLGASLMALRPLMLCDVASTPEQIVDALTYVDAIGQRRLSGVDRDKSPIVLVVDETTGLLQRSNTATLLTNVLGKIAQETRKVGLYALCIGQNFHSDVMPTTVRDCFVSFISCRARKRVAATMADDNEFGKTAADLTTGQMVWMTPAGDVHRLAFPNCTAADLELVADHIFDDENAADAEKPALQVVGSGSASGSKGGSASGSDPLSSSYLERHFPKAGTTNGTTSGTTTARAERVRSLILDGKNMSQIITDVWQIDGRGRAYQSAVDEYYQVLQSLLGGN